MLSRVSDTDDDDDSNHADDVDDLNSDVTTFSSSRWWYP